jgi:hypothetical protein
VESVETGVDTDVDEDGVATRETLSPVEREGGTGAPRTVGLDSDSVASDCRSLRVSRTPYSSNRLRSKFGTTKPNNKLSSSLPSSSVITSRGACEGA